MLEVIKSNQERLTEVAFSLYSNELSTNQIGEVFEKIYGKAYSKSGISFICQESRQRALEWLERPIESYCPAISIDAHYNNITRSNKASLHV